MTLSRREISRAATIKEIKAAARKQMGKNGAGAFSLGAIAREMGLTTPALYRYFANRDALVTVLIVDAYEAMADALAAAVAPLDKQDYPGRFRSLLLAYRDWALAQPESYTLIHGNPIPGYALPEDKILPGAMRSLELIGDLLHAAFAEGQLQIPDAYAQIPTALRQKLQPVRQAFAEDDLPTNILTLAIMIWIQVHGLIWTELHGHLPAELLQDGALYRMEIDAMSQRLGLAKG